MAEAILKSFDPKLEIYSAGLEPVDHVSPIAIEVMAEIGIDLQPSVPRDFCDYNDLEITYLITVGEGTLEELIIPDINYKRKLHLGFRSPYKGSKCQDEIKEKCREVRDELLSEMDYFYNRILKKEVVT
jgi:arsenate reductase